ncbi:MAG TPA: hypothetical protein VFQ39_12085 [Longimicrobium sp.]|nr:hypothetical protein [Longimicrobium sp.]
MPSPPLRPLTLVLTLATAACAGEAAPPSAGAPAERIAAPFEETSYYARNVWDMQAFGGRIYLAHGDEIDNRGPVTLWTLDPATGGVSPGYRTDEEQVDLFRVLRGELYVPGHDPRGRWSRGNFYRLARGGWTRYRTIPHGVHTFDLAVHEGRLFAALGTSSRPTLVYSDDEGRTWMPATAETRRMHVLFEFAGGLYAAPKLRTDAAAGAGTLLRFDGTRFVSTGVGGAALLPGLPDTAGRMVRPLEFRGYLVYVVASGAINWKPAALAASRTLRDARAIPLPDAYAVPYDLLSRDSTLYVLAAAPDGEHAYTILVYATRDLTDWHEVVRFTAPTFARSFEESGGDFYFGLGCTYQAPSPASGEVLRVRRAALRR